MSVFTKATPGVLDYSIDYTAWLAGDTIATSVWAGDAGLGIDYSTNDTVSATVGVSGGTIGTTYSVINTITTAAGLQDRRRIKITVAEAR